jgi:hypothetical protein
MSYQIQTKFGIISCTLYLGDGVYIGKLDYGYVIFTYNGTEVVNEIFLKPSTVERFNLYIKCDMELDQEINSLH